MYDVCNCDECRRERGGSSQMLGTVIVWSLIVLMVGGLVFLAVAY